MATFLGRVLRQFQQASLLSHASNTQLIQHNVRGTCVFRRMYPPNLRRPGVKKALKKREYVYILEENKAVKPAGDISLLLLTDVDGIGMKGEIVEVSKRIGRMQLLPSGLAAYPTPENVEKMQEEMKKIGETSKHSIWAQKTIRQLQGMHLSVPMNPKTEWTLDKSHVKVAFRTAGVEMNDECLTLPDEIVTSPCEITVKVTVNKTTEIEIPVFVYHYYEDARLAPGGQLPKLPRLWSQTRASFADIALEFEKSQNL